ncbi:hypothetical protein [Flavobacterium sp.]|uniref:hypothetical protein n=1 Tax=Flavobacterium sp. TaxID=239 RepID=UPI0025D25007|nr:hypothetical protein [Flavobacterium sp.]
MKKVFFFVFFCTILVSCKLTDQKSAEEEIIANETLRDSSVVNDKDEHGCLASAGYVWSKINKECIKAFTGVPLNPVANPDSEDESLSAYVLFSEDGNQAEVFLPKETNSIVLTRSAEGKPWTFEDWQLVPWKGFVLKRANENKFAGDGIPGKKITGSDTEEQ